MAKQNEQGTGGATPPGEGGNNEAAETVESLKAKLEEQAGHISKLNEESKKHRLEAKTAKEGLDKATLRESELKKALGLGEADPVDEKLAQLKKAADEKNSRVLLKAAVMADVGKDAHDPDAVWQLMQSDLKDVKVDLDTETVDKDSLKSKIADFRKSKAFLFNAGTGGAGSQQRQMPGGGGAPGGSNAYATWQQMLQSGDHKGAGAYYQKNRAEIIKGLK